MEWEVEDTQKTLTATEIKYDKHTSIAREPGTSRPSGRSNSGSPTSFLLSYLPTLLHASPSPTSLLSYLPSYLTYLLSYLPPLLPASSSPTSFLLSYLPTLLHASPSPTFLLSYLPTLLHASPSPTSLLSYLPPPILPTSSPTCLLFSHQLIRRCWRNISHSTWLFPQLALQAWYWRVVLYFLESSYPFRHSSSNSLHMQMYLLWNYDNLGGSFAYCCSQVSCPCGLLT
jgi:hypothetical protein